LDAGIELKSKYYLVLQNDIINQQIIQDIEVVLSLGLAINFTVERGGGCLLRIKLVHASPYFVKKYCIFTKNNLLVFGDYEKCHTEKIIPPPLTAKFKWLVPYS